MVLFGAAHILNIEALLLGNESFSHKEWLQANLWFICKVWPIVRRKLSEAGLAEQIVVRVVGMTSEHAAKYFSFSGVVFNALADMLANWDMT